MKTHKTGVLRAAMTGTWQMWDTHRQQLADGRQMAARTKNRGSGEGEERQTEKVLPRQIRRGQRDEEHAENGIY